MPGQLPNILFVVWDACRYDYAQKYAPNLRELGDSNLTFERAITPAPWSLPAHASLFSGEYPHEHGRTKLGDSLDGLPLVPELSEKGYTCYGVSANGFACPRTGFDEGFDEFYYTRGREQYYDGLNISGYALSRARERDGMIRPGLDTLGAALRHEHPIKSLVNMATVGAGSLGVRMDALQKIPHPLFASDSGYCYDPEANTKRIEDILRREAQTESPFFLFTNYMDTHRPYKPDEEKQRRHLNRDLSRSELERLNDEVAHPWKFVAADCREGIDDEDVEAVRGLYAGEVETADEHLGRLLTLLKETGLREDTLIVVTSDHGENLGETDEMGRRRMGHESSISNAVTHIPLTVAHTDLSQRKIKNPYSLCAIHDLLTDGIGKNTISDALRLNDIVSCQYPKAGGEHLYEKFPDVPTDILDHRIKGCSVTSYSNEWRVLKESAGTENAWESDQERTIAAAPDVLVERCDSHLSALIDCEDGSELESAERSQLEALGYL